MLATIPWIHGWTYLIYWCYSKHDFEIIYGFRFLFYLNFKTGICFFLFFLEKVKTDNPITTSGLNLVARLCRMFSCCLKSSFFITLFEFDGQETPEGPISFVLERSVPVGGGCVSQIVVQVLCFLLVRLQISPLLTWLVLCPASLGWALKVIKHWLEWRVMVERNGRPNCLPI